MEYRDNIHLEINGKTKIEAEETDYFHYIKLLYQCNSTNDTTINIEQFWSHF